MLFGTQPDKSELCVERMLLGASNEIPKSVEVKRPQAANQRETEEVPLLATPLPLATACPPSLSPFRGGASLSRYLLAPGTSVGRRLGSSSERTKVDFHRSQHRVVTLTRSLWRLLNLW